MYGSQIDHSTILENTDDPFFSPTPGQGYIRNFLMSLPAAHII